MTARQVYGMEFLSPVPAVKNRDGSFRTAPDGCPCCHQEVVLNGKTDGVFCEFHLHLENSQRRWQMMAAPSPQVSAVAMYGEPRIPKSLGQVPLFSGPEMTASNERLRPTLSSSAFAAAATFSRQMYQQGHMVHTDPLHNTPMPIDGDALCSGSCGNIPATPQSHAMQNGYDPTQLMPPPPQLNRREYGAPQQPTNGLYRATVPPPPAQLNHAGTVITPQRIQAIEPPEFMEHKSFEASQEWSLRPPKYLCISMKVPGDDFVEVDAQIFRLAEDLYHSLDADYPPAPNGYSAKKVEHYNTQMANAMKHVKAKLEITSPFFRTSAKASCIQLVKKMVIIHTNGIPKELHKKAEKAHKLDFGIKCSERVQRLIQVLRDDKRVAKDVIDRTNLDEIAYGPEGYSAGKDTYFSSNHSRMLREDEKNAKNAAKRAAETAQAPDFGAKHEETVERLAREKGAQADASKREVDDVGADVEEVQSVVPPVKKTGTGAKSKKRTAEDVDGSLTNAGQPRKKRGRKAASPIFGTPTAAYGVQQLEAPLALSPTSGEFDNQASGAVMAPIHNMQLRWTGNPRDLNAPAGTLTAPNSRAPTPLPSSMVEMPQSDASVMAQNYEYAKAMSGADLYTPYRSTAGPGSEMRQFGSYPPQSDFEASTIGFATNPAYGPTSYSSETPLTTSAASAATPSKAGGNGRNRSEGFYPTHGVQPGVKDVHIDMPAQTGAEDDEERMDKTWEQFIDSMKEGFGDDFNFDGFI